MSSSYIKYEIKHPKDIVMKANLRPLHDGSYLQVLRRLGSPRRAPTGRLIPYMALPNLSAFSAGFWCRYP